MLAEGDTAVPALGMDELAQQLAAPLPPASLRLGIAVDALLREGGRVPGEHLLSVTVLGDRREADADLEAKARTELSGWFGDDAIAHQRLLSLSRIAFGQFPQPAGF